MSGTIRTVALTLLGTMLLLAEAIATVTCVGMIALAVYAIL